MILAFPAIAQTSSDKVPSNGTAGAQVQSESTGTSSDPATQKTGSDTAGANTKTNSTTAESKPEDPQPGSDPGTKKAGAAVLININKTKQEMTFFGWYRKI